MKNNTLSTVFYIALGIFLAFGVNQGLAFGLGTDLPIVAVESNSMLPTFSKGDGLILQGVPADDLQIGDVIVFTPPGKQIAVVHRIIKINDDGTFQTKGDANLGQLSYETKIPPSSVHGKMILILPYIGWFKIGMTEYLIPNAVWVLLAVMMLVGFHQGIMLKKNNKE